MLLMQGQYLARAVEGQVSFSILLPKLFVRFPGIPEIERHIDTGAGKLAQQASFAEMGVAAEELRPVPIRAVDFLKAPFKTRLDIVLPED